MGISCDKAAAKEKDIAFSTKAVLNPQQFQKMSFYFSTENLLRIDADCLLLFSDEKLNLNKNKHLNQVGKSETRKITEYAQSALKQSKSKMVPGHVLFFPVAISTLRFRYVCIACLKIWDGNEKISLNLSLVLDKILKTIEGRVQSIAFTEFNDELGIPTQLGCKAVVEGLQKCKNWLKIVTFICNDVVTQNYYMEKIGKSMEGEQIQARQSRTQRSSMASQSNYY